MYLALPGSIERMTPAGQVTRYAGVAAPGSSGDGGPAISAEIGLIRGLALESDGSLVLAEEGGLAEDGAKIYRIRRITPDGVITSSAGGVGTVSAVIADGTPALGAPLGTDGVTIAPNGAIYAAGTLSGVVYRLVSQFSGLAGVSAIIPSTDGSELYEFHARGQHLRTRHALTGAVRYAFGYDATGHLTSIADGDGLVTVVEWSGAELTAIEAPFGQRTTFQVDGNGYLSRIEAPGNRVTQLTSTATGLLTQLVDPNNHGYTFDYDSLGRLLVDHDPAGGSQTLTRSEISDGWEVTRTTGLARVWTYRTEDLPGGGRRFTNGAPDGTSTTTETGVDGSTEMTSSDGMRVETAWGPDPRFGLEAAVPAKVVVRSPGGRTLTTTATRTAVLSDPTNLLSLQSQTETTVINGRTYQTVFNAGTRTFTSTTPAGRTSTTTIDTQGRVTRLQTGTLTPVEFGYDLHGRLTAVTQGTRQSTIAFDTSGRPSTLTDALARTVTFGYDAADRVETQTLPDTRVIGFGYDGNSNVTSITPPGRPQHGFTYTPVNLAGLYTPPPVAGTGATTYGFTIDRQPTTIDRPDGHTTAFAYGLTDGRLTSVTFSRGQLQYGYDTAGRVSTLTDPGGVNLAFTYDGALPLSETWSGGLTGAVSRTFTDNFEVATERVNGAHLVSFVYDADRLLTGAGALTVTRHAQNGLVTGTTLGSTTEAFEYNDFGELSRQTARVSGADVFDVQYIRDALGRITQRIEVIDGVTRVWEYGYDAAGRLESVERNNTLIAFYIYDANGNRTQADTESGSFTGTYDNQDRLLTYGNATYTYGPNGELATKTVGTQVTTYEYDTLGNLIRVVLPNTDVVTYTVDGRGRRVAKSMNGIRVKGWLYGDQLRPVAEIDNNGTVMSRFVYGARSNVPEYIVKSGITYRVFCDHLGSPRIIVNANSGEVVQRLDFDTFGESIQNSHQAFQSFGFAGGIVDLDTGLSKFGARDYDPVLGRWTAKDPLLFDGSGVNVYAYGGSEPVNRIDQDGLQIKVLGTPTEYRRAIAYLKQDPSMKAIIETLEQSTDVYTVSQSVQHDDSYNPRTRTINWDPLSALQCTGGGQQSPALGLGHEMAHAVGSFLTPVLAAVPWPGYDDLEERRVITGPERTAAKRLGEGIRFDHGAVRIYHVASSTSR